MQSVWHTAAINMCKESVATHMTANIIYNAVLLIFLPTVAKVTLKLNKHPFSEGTSHKRQLGF